MSDRSHSVRPDRTASRLRAALRRRRSSKQKAPEGGLTLQAVPTCVPADLALLTPTMRVAVVEDACWALAMHAWHERRPPRWRPTARRQWAAEGRTLDAKRDRIRALVEAARDEQPQCD